MRQRQWNKVRGTEYEVRSTLRVTTPKSEEKGSLDSNRLVLDRFANFLFIRSSILQSTKPSQDQTGGDQAEQQRKPTKRLVFVEDVFKAFAMHAARPAKAVMNRVENDPGPQTAGLHAQITEHYAESERQQRLLHDLVRDGEEQAAYQNRPPLIAGMPQAAENEAAEGKLLANRRD